MKANVLLKIHPDDNKNVSKQWLLQFHPSGPAQIVAIDDIDTTGIKPATVLHGSDKTICSMFDGSLSSEYAYLRGWLKIDGHMGVALKIKNLLDVAQSI